MRFRLFSTVFLRFPYFARVECHQSVGGGGEAAALAPSRRTGPVSGVSDYFKFFAAALGLTPKHFLFFEVCGFCFVSQVFLHFPFRRFAFMLVFPSLFAFHTPISAPGILRSEVHNVPAAPRILKIPIPHSSGPQPARGRKSQSGTAQAPNLRGGSFARKPGSRAGSGGPPFRELRLSESPNGSADE